MNVFIFSNVKNLSNKREPASLATRASLVPNENGPRKCTHYYAKENPQHLL